MFKDMEDFQAFGKSNGEAFVASATAWTQGMQNVAAEMTEATAKAFEGSKATAEKVAAAKSPEKALEIQTRFAKDSFDAYLGEANRIGELYMKAALSAFKPLEVQASKVGAKAGTKASA